MDYEKPVVTDFGSIVDHTFTTPGGVKGCQTNCHLDMFNEQSALSASPLAQDGALVSRPELTLGVSKYL